MWTPPLKHLHDWAIDRPILLAMPCQQAVVMLPMLYRFIERLRTGIAGRLSRGLPDAATWLALYQNRQQVEATLLETFFSLGRPGNPDGVMASLAQGALRGQDTDLREAAQAVIREMPPEHLALVRAEMEKALRYQYQQHLQMLAADLAGAVTDEDLDLDAAFAKPEALFFILTYLPCTLEYGVSPWHLYEQARAGDLGALDDLLRVDKLLLCDPVIAERAAKRRLGGDKGGAEVLAGAFLADPKYRMDRAKLNVLAAGLLSKLADSLGCHLNAEELRNLFDAAAKDRSGGRELIETAFPESPEACKKAVQRARDFWPHIPPRDRESEQTCPEDWGVMAVVLAADDSSARPTWIDNRPTGPAV